ncbi:ABC transporter permease [Winogradskyella sp.]|uniref:ABC transporter permease n=1 Tax=Winogradskyella sp. TaxID=1883156 RepID=UPI00261F278F|nr:ABC transporter permease [Winogradskyella sp.]
MIKNYLKIAWRKALKNKSLSFISLLSLILGISLFFVISIWVQDELSYDSGFAQSDSIYRLESHLTLQDGTDDALQTVGWPVGKSIVENYPEVEALTYMRDWSPIVTVGNNKYFEEALMVDENFFEVFNYQLEEGNIDDALKNPRSIVLTSSLKEKYFGDKNAVGKTLLLSDTIPYQITGVLKEMTVPSHLQFNMLGSFSTICSNNPEFCANQFSSGWFNVNVYNYLKIKPSANGIAFADKVKDIVQVYGWEAVERYGFQTEIVARPLKDIYLKSGLSTGIGPVGTISSIRLFLGIGVFILLLACLNFINLTTASSIERAKEIGVKKVFGSNRKSLIVQFLVETGFLCITAVLGSLVVIILTLPFFNHLTGKNFEINDVFTIERVCILIGILIVLIPLAGFYPAWILASFKPIKVLKGHFSHSVSGNSLRKGLVVFQFVVSIAFIMSTMIINQQMDFMQSKNLGFEKEKIIVLDVDKVPWGLRHSSAEVFKNTLKSNIGITNVSASAAIPGLTGWPSQFAYPEGRTKQEGLIVEYIPVDFEYIETLGIDFVEGRNFIKGSEADAEDALIINEAAVKSFGWDNNESAIGKALATSGKEGKVIGVLKDYHQHGLQNEINPLVLGRADFIRVFAIKYKSLSAKEVIGLITATWNDIYKDYPLEYSFMDEILQRQYEREQKLSSFFKLATFLSILIACLGLLGLSIYTARKRIKEIGIRKVLGASVTNIVFLLSKAFLKLVIIAILIAVPIAWFGMDKWLQDFAFRIDLKWWVFTLAGISALVIAFLTICYHSIGAALSNPTTNLRTE